MRVPSGNTTIHRPSSSRLRPWSIICRTAMPPAPRSMEMQRSMRRPQPTKGIHVSSRFSTQACGGRITACAKVSQARGMFHQRDCCAGRQVLVAFDHVVEAAKDLQRAQQHAAPRTAPARSGRGWAGTRRAMVKGIAYRNVNSRKKPVNISERRNCMSISCASWRCRAGP